MRSSGHLEYCRPIYILHNFVGHLELLAFCYRVILILMMTCITPGKNIQCE